MKIQLVSESIEDFVVNSKQRVYDKFERINNILRNSSRALKIFKDPNLVTKAQQDFFNLIKSINPIKIDLTEKDINLLNNDELLQLNNGLDFIIDDYDLKSTFAI